MQMSFIPEGICEWPVPSIWLIFTYVRDLSHTNTPIPKFSPYDAHSSQEKILKIGTCQNLTEKNPKFFQIFDQF